MRAVRLSNAATDGNARRRYLVARLVIGGVCDHNLRHPQFWAI